MASGLKLLNHHVSSHYFITLWTWSILSGTTHRGAVRKQKHREKLRLTGKKDVVMKGDSLIFFLFLNPPLCADITLKGPGGHRLLPRPSQWAHVCYVRPTRAHKHTHPECPGNTFTLSSCCFIAGLLLWSETVAAQPISESLERPKQGQDTRSCLCICSICRLLPVYFRENMMCHLKNILFEWKGVKVRWFKKASRWFSALHVGKCISGCLISVNCNWQV